MAASEALSLIALTLADVAGGLALSDAAGWNQTADDWAFIIEHGHAIGFRTASGTWVATAAALVYSGGLGWISMVLVAQEWRHRGLASLLLDGCVKRLRAAHVTPVLDATPAGVPVYRHLGFRAGFDLERWEGSGPLALPVRSAIGGADRERERDADADRDGDNESEGGVRVADAADFDLIAALDQAASGVGRRVLLQNFFVRPDTRAWISRDGSGFVLARAGHRATQIGPLAAADPAAALALLAAALRTIAGPVFLDVPKRWAALAAWLEQIGFVRQRPYTRMSLGAAAPLDCGDRLFVLAGPEFG